MVALSVERLDGLIERARHYSIGGVIVMAAVHERFIPPFMVVGFLLAMVHVARHYRSIPLRAYWPLGLLPLFYVLSLLNLPGGFFGWGGEVAPMLRVGYLLGPLSLIDLRPTRLWGTLQVLGGVGVIGLGLVLAVYHSLSYVDGEWVWNIWTGVSPELVAENPLYCFFSGFCHFYYVGFTFQLGLFPSFLSYTLLLSLIVSLHRVLTVGRRKRFYAFATSFLLCGLILTGSRTMVVAALLCLLLFIVYLVAHRRIPWYGVVVGLFLFGVVGYGIVQQPRMKRLVTAIKGDNVVYDLMRDEQRLGIWYEIYQHRGDFLPWGMGTSRSRPSVSAWMAPHCDPDDIPTKTHNEVVEALVEQGWPGFALMVAVLAMPLLFARRFRLVELLLLVPLYVLLSLESMSSIAIGVASLAFTNSILWGLAIYRHRGLSDGSKPYL